MRFWPQSFPRRLGCWMFISNIILSWNNAPIINTPNATIQIQVNRGDNNWVMVNQTNGSRQSAGVNFCDTNENDTFYSQNCSAKINSSTTSLTWNNAHSRPSAGQTFEYRIRYRSDSIQGLYSNWTTLSLHR